MILKVLIAPRFLFSASAASKFYNHFALFDLLHFRSIPGLISSFFKSSRGHLRGLHEPETRKANQVPSCSNGEPFRAQTSADVSAVKSICEMDAICKVCNNFKILLQRGLSISSIASHEHMTFSVHIFLWIYQLIPGLIGPPVYSVMRISPFKTLRETYPCCLLLFISQHIG